MSYHRDSQGRFAKAPSSNGSGKVTANSDEMWISELIGNAMLSRSQLFREFLDTRRDINAEAGYADTAQLTCYDFGKLYDREPIAARVVDVLADESWMAYPEIYESENPDELTAFEQRWKELATMLRGGSKFMGHIGSPVWEYLQRLDRLCGVGRYGVMLLGVSDGKDLSVEPSGSAPRDLLFLRVFDERSVQINKVDTNVNSPRYGQPVEYNLELGEPIGVAKGQLEPAKVDVRRVHWKRIHHVADGLGSSEVYGVPRMQSVFNRLHDLRKLYAGSAEMYWRGAFPGLSIETNPRLGTHVKVDKDAMRSQMEQYMNGLQRYLTLTGMTAKSMAPQVVDPTPQIEVQIDAICIRLGIPKRIFKGSERGELASTQDEATFNDRLRSRQNGFITPRIIIPFIDRLIDLGVLPEPESYSVVWPDLDALTDDEKAQVAERRSRAMMNYTTGGVETILPLVDFLTRELQYSQGDSESIMKRLEQELKSVQDRLELQRGQSTVPTDTSGDSQAQGEDQTGEPASAPNAE